MVAPLISIVIPCFNHGRFLPDAIRSVGAPRRPCEIVVVDDGSTDGSHRIAATCDSRVPVRVVRQPNAGLAAARNRGLKESVGAYLVFLDADDCLAPGALDLAAGELERHPEAAFVFGRCRMMAGDGTVLPTPAQGRIESDDAYRELLIRNYIWTPAAAMFRRAAVERAGGFDTRFNAAADYDLYLRITREGPAWDHGQEVARYRQHGGNMSGDASRMLSETLAVLGLQSSVVARDPTLSKAYREGRRAWQEFYGTHLVNEIRAHARAAEWGRVLTKAVTLARLHPRGLVHHAWKKTMVILTRRSRRQPHTGT